MVLHILVNECRHLSGWQHSLKYLILFSIILLMKASYYIVFFLILEVAVCWKSVKIALYGHYLD